MEHNKQVIRISGKPALHIPAEQVNPNKLSGAYIIALALTLPRSELKVAEFTKRQVTKIYQRHGFNYICPQVGEAPPEGYRWILMGKKYSREVYRAV